MTTPAARAEALIRRYLDACNRRDRDAVAACFAPDAVHYFPPGIPRAPWRGAEAIADGFAWFVDRTGASWALEHALVAPDGSEAAIEWTSWSGDGTPVRGTEWYAIDMEKARITEIRAYLAAGPDAGPNELPGFDAAARGWSTAPPRRG